MTDPSTSRNCTAENLSLASLILSILSLILVILIGILSVLFSLIGIICGHIAIKKYRLSGIREGSGMAKAGVVIGWIGLVISLLTGLVMWYLYQQQMQEYESIMESLEGLNL